MSGPRIPRQRASRTGQQTTMLRDTAEAGRAWRDAVAASFQDVADQFREVAQQQQQTAIILTQMESRMKAVEATLQDLDQENREQRKAAPETWRGWVSIALMGLALLISLLGTLLPHISLH